MPATTLAAKAKKLLNLQHKRANARVTTIMQTPCVQAALADLRCQKEKVDRQLEAAVLRGNKHYRAQGSAERQVEQLKRELAAAQKIAKATAQTLNEKAQALQHAEKAAESLRKTLQRKENSLGAASASYWAFRNIELKLQATRGKTSKQRASDQRLLARLRQMARRPPGGYSERAGCHGMQ